MTREQHRDAHVRPVDGPASVLDREQIAGRQARRLPPLLGMHRREGRRVPRIEERDLAGVARVVRAGAGPLGEPGRAGAPGHERIERVAVRDEAVQRLARRGVARLGREAPIGGQRLRCRCRSGPWRRASRRSRARSPPRRCGEDVMAIPGAVVEIDVLAAGRWAASRSSRRAPLPSPFRAAEKDDRVAVGRYADVAARRDVGGDDLVGPRRCSTARRPPRGRRRQAK